MGKVRQIGPVLLQQRLIELIARLERRLDLRRHGLLAGERPTGRKPHQKERQRDHRQDDGYCL